MGVKEEVKEEEGEGEGKGKKGKGKAKETTIATLVAHVFVHGMTMRDAGQRVQPNTGCNGTGLKGVLMMAMWPKTMRTDRHHDGMAATDPKLSKSDGNDWLTEKQPKSQTWGFARDWYYQRTPVLAEIRYLCAIYIPPAESHYHDEEYLNNIHREISHFQAQGNVLLCGNFNARTGSEPNDIDPKGSEYVFGQNPPSLTRKLPPRNNLDQTVNKNSRELVQLCRASGLYILNCRIRGDSFGRFTCCSGLGASVVDYAITDMDQSSFSAFTVNSKLCFLTITKLTFISKHIKHQNKTDWKPAKCIRSSRDTDGLQAA
ncbi:hypothetical protein PO909_004611 [Leuciscus waleckii]